jgi:hypothetical protein
MAAVLASLRVFAHIIGSTDIDDLQQNELLHLVHIITRFPPAVRAVHILMQGKSLQFNESAALVHSLAAATKALIPMDLLANDARRSLEGSRLCLGLILSRAQQRASNRNSAANLTPGKPNTMPYISSYHTVDLRDVKTLEPVVHAVLTNLGMVNRGVFEAFSGSSILGDSPSCYLQRSDVEDTRLRVALLYGGASLEVPFYDAQVLGVALEQASIDEDSSLHLRNLSTDMTYLASLCEETKLVVVAPQQLSSAKEPCLTLDRYGNMAVYTGRAACAAPGHDHNCFHPLEGNDMPVDVNIVAQHLEPIIETRRRDGTNVFDLFSATYQRKDARPTELVVLAVDCSRSIGKPSEFPGATTKMLIQHTRVPIFSLTKKTMQIFFWKK